MTTRQDLPADTREAIAQVDRLSAGHQQDIQDLAALRGRLVRELVSRHGGVARAAARELGVTDVQVGRILGEDLARSVRAALAAAGWTRDAYTLRIAGQRAWVALATHDEDRQPHHATALNAAGALCNALRAAGLDTATAAGVALDVSGRGPAAVLAAGGEVEVSIRHQE